MKEQRSITHVDTSKQGTKAHWWKSYESSSVTSSHQIWTQLYEIMDSNTTSIKPTKQFYGKNLVISQSLKTWSQISL